MIKQRLAMLLMLGLFAVNAKAQTGQTLQDSMFWEGNMHRYRVYVPNVVKCALVVHLHGYGSNSLLEQLYTNYMPVADTAGFIVAYPDGLVDPLGSQSWNVGWFLQTPNNDVGFISTLIDTIVARYTLDPNAVFVSGISNGGFMAHRLACEASDRIAAIASVSGGMTPLLYNTCSPNNPIPTLEIHGTNDTTIPYNGSTAPETMHLDSVVKFNAAIIGANATPQIDTLPHNASTVNGTSVVRYVYTNGSNGATSEFYKIINGEHVNWPGFDNSTTNDFEAAIEIWRFFRQNQACTQTNVQETHTPQIQVYPNPSTSVFNVFVPKSWPSCNYELTDCTGRVIKEDMFETEILQLDLNGYAPGLYLFKWTDGRSHQRVKLMLH